MTNMAVSRSSLPRTSQTCPPSRKPDDECHMKWGYSSRSGGFASITSLTSVTSLLFAAVFSLGCTESESEKATGANLEITVIRVESPSPEQPGAEHCEKAGQGCKPLAAQQKLPPRGVVRTFAGGKVSLDFGGGRRLDLDGLSQAELGEGLASLQKGDFSIETTPLVTQEKLSPLRFRAGSKVLTSSSDTPTTTSVSVQNNDDALLTVRRGALQGVDLPGAGAPIVGQSFRLASAQVFRTGLAGQELRSLPEVAPHGAEYGDLLTPVDPQNSRGLGTMTARLPNTDQVRDGVHLAKHHVKVVIRDGYARTEVEEEFQSTSPHVLEGRYRFPIPGDASVSRLALWVGDQLIEGEVLERTRAASIYRSIVDRPVPRDPALLEWVSGGEMSLKVFPILPNQSRRIILAYNQALSMEGGTLRYVYPLSLGRGRETRIDDLSISVEASDSRAKLSNLRVAGYDAKTGREGAWYKANVQLKGTSPQRDFVMLIDREANRDAQLSTFIDEKKQPGKPEGHFSLRVSADLPDGLERPALLATDRAIVLDISHSQSLETIRAQGALAYGILRDMNQRERFVLLACDSACSEFRPNREGSERLAQARDWLLALRPGGSSDIAGALVSASQQLAITSPRSQERKRQVIYIGDGQASSGDLSVDTISRRSADILARENIDLRIIGAGRTLDEDQLYGLAVKLGATWDRLQSGSSLESRIGEISIDLRRPTIKNARLILPSSLRSEDALTLPALRLGQEVLISGEILSSAPGNIGLAGELDGKAYLLSKPISPAASNETQNPLVPRLWARAKIQNLQSAPQTPETVAEIVKLSETHRTMSRYTSFLVLESEKMYEDFGVTRTTKDKSDQADAKFSEAARGRLREEESEPQSLSSFELDDEAAPLGDAASRKDEAKGSDWMEGRSEESAKSRAATGSGAAADRDAPRREAPAQIGSSAAAPMASAPRPAPAPAPRPSAPKKSADSGPPSDPYEPSEIIERPRLKSHIPAPYGAHLVFAQADDEWRKWGEENIAKLQAKLREHSESRQVHEEYIRGMLMAGRFNDAFRVAEGFTKLDPDYSPARELLAYSAVVTGNHELARLMLDVATETAPRDAAAHAQAARSFDAVGDGVRSCAHFRSLAELAPEVTETALRAQSCWAEMLSPRPTTSTAPAQGEPGQLQIEVECDTGIAKEDCPSPLAIAPDGSVLSPWTPGAGRSERHKVSFVKLRSGLYRIMVLGGAPSARGKVKLIGRSETKNFAFEGGSLHTIASATVSFY